MPLLVFLDSSKWRDVCGSLVRKHSILKVLGAKELMNTVLLKELLFIELMSNFFHNL